LQPVIPSLPGCDRADSRANSAAFDLDKTHQDAVSYPIVAPIWASAVTGSVGRD
jgi:hypothetical protein